MSETSFSVVAEQMLGEGLAASISDQLDLLLVSQDKRTAALGLGFRLGTPAALQVLDRYGRLLIPYDPVNLCTDPDHEDFSKMFKAGGSLVLKSVNAVDPTPLATLENYIGRHYNLGGSLLGKTHFEDGFDLLSSINLKVEEFMDKASEGLAVIDPWLMDKIEFTESKLSLDIEAQPKFTRGVGYVLHELVVSTIAETEAQNVKRELMQLAVDLKNWDGTITELTN